MRAYTPLFSALALAVGLSACASAPVKNAQRTSGDGITGALVQPLEDFNLIRDKIPAVLNEAAEAPYANPSPFDCITISTELGRLDDALGPDIDVVDPNPAGRAEEGGAMAGRAVVGAVRGLTTDWIPMRSWVRYLTGAERNDKNFRKALDAGLIRRAYLKGVAQSQGCQVVAARAPSPFPAPPSTPSSVN